MYIRSRKENGFGSEIELRGRKRWTCAAPVRDIGTCMRVGYATGVKGEKNITVVNSSFENPSKCLRRGNFSCPKRPTPPEE